MTKRRVRLIDLIDNKSDSGVWTLLGRNYQQSQPVDRRKGTNDDVGTANFVESARVPLIVSEDQNN